MVTGSTCHILDAIATIESYIVVGYDEFMGVDLGAVWEVTQQDMAAVKRHIQDILAK